MEKSKFLFAVLSLIVFSLLVAVGVMAFSGPGSGSAPSVNPTVFWKFNGSDMNYTSGNVGIGTTTPANKLTVNGIIESITGGMKSPVYSSAPSACNAANDGVLVFTSYRTPCVCKNGTGWVSAYDGTTACVWAP